MNNKYPISEHRLAEIAECPNAEQHEADVVTLAAWALEKHQCSDCDGFALPVKDFATKIYRSLDEMVDDRYGDALAYSEPEKIAFLREWLKYTISEPDEETPSRHHAKFEFNGRVFCVGLLVTISGYESVLYDAFGASSVDSFEEALREQSYILNENELDQLTDEYLHSLWD